MLDSEEKEVVDEAWVVDVLEYMERVSHADYGKPIAKAHPPMRSLVEPVRGSSLEATGSGQPMDTGAIDGVVDGVVGPTQG